MMISDRRAFLKAETASAKALGLDHAYVFKDSKEFGGEAEKGRE